jgi:tRNA (mo5U34)-methyltransferase
MAFIEHRLADDPTNWWAANHACVAALLRASGLRVLRRIVSETYLCEPSGHGPPELQPMLEEEYLTATGQRRRPFR